MNKYKVLITDHEYNNIDNELRILNELDVEVIDLQSRDEDEIINIAKDCDAIITQYAKINKNIIRALEKCKVICKYAIGIDGIDIEEATKKGIYVTNVHDYCSDEVSTHALSLILDASRGTTFYNDFVKRGHWYNADIKLHNLKSSTVGVVSFGRIAKKFVEKVTPLCKNVLVYDKYINPKIPEDYGVDLVTFEELISKSDYISIHAPLTPETKHLFNKEVFKRMKKTSVIINVARGGLICTEDLIWALKNAEIAYAALDVLEEEPPKKSLELMFMDNVLLTPHAAWYSEESQKILQSTPAEEIIRVLKGEKPLNIVNKNLVL